MDEFTKKRLLKENKKNGIIGISALQAAPKFGMNPEEFDKMIMASSDPFAILNEMFSQDAIDKAKEEISASDESLFESRLSPEHRKEIEATAAQIASKVGQLLGKPVDKQSIIALAEKSVREILAEKEGQM
jgi:hypothetical protein